MAEQYWAGAGRTTGPGGIGEGQSSWSGGHSIKSSDAGIPLSLLSGGLSKNPKSLYRAQPSLRKVITFAARNIASVPMPIYIRQSNKDRERDTTSQAALLLNAPSKFMTGSKLFNDLTVDWMLFDRFLVVLVEGELKRVPAGLIRVKEDFLGGLTAIGIQTKDGLIDVTELPFAYDSGWGDDSAAGISGLHTIGPTMEEQARAIKWRSEHWDRAARVSGILTASGVLSKPVRQRIEESWKAYSADDAGATPLLEEGITYLPMKRESTVDLTDLEGRKLTDAEVASFYHIPPELIGARQGTFSNISAFRQMLFGPTLGPIMTRIEDAFNLSIIPALAPPNAYGEFNREAALAGSHAEQSAYYQKAAGGPYMTRAEIRSRQNLPFIEGTDELIVPMNVTEGGLADPSDTAPGQKAEAGGEPTWV